MAKFTPEERADIIRSRLKAAFLPSELVVTDDSHLHVGHAGAKNGASHFSVKIKSTQFNGLSLIAQHRLIYQTLQNLIPEEIHALKIITQWISSENEA